MEAWKDGAAGGRRARLGDAGELGAVVLGVEALEVRVQLLHVDRARERVGDLRRLLGQDPELMGKNAGDCMHRRPHTITAGELASAALHLMEERKITSLFVCGEDDRLEGVVHIHDLWGLELF